jgi:hypothetical protein
MFRFTTVERCFYFVGNVTSCVDAMSKERELLKRWFSEFGKIHADIKLLRDTQTLLAQPEQEPEPLLAETKIEWYGKGFRQGVNEFAAPKPLTEDVIYALDDEGIVENMDDHQVRYVIRWIRRVEKAHGIGGGNE